MTLRGKLPVTSNLKRTELLASPNIGNRLINPFMGWFILFLPLLGLGFISVSKRLPPNAFSFDDIINYQEIQSTAKLGILFVLGIKIFLNLIPIFTITILELFNKGKLKISEFRNSSLGRVRRSKGYKYADIWYQFLFTLTHTFPFIVTVTTIGLLRFNQSIEDWSNSIYTNILPTPSSHFDSVVLILIALLIKDFCGFIAHRMAHKVPFIWDLHEFHHSATEMTILNTKRNTPWEGIFTKPFILPIDVLTGLLLNACLVEGYFLPFYIYLIDTMIGEATFYVGHSSLKVIFPKPFSYLYMSPSLHWLHHSDKPEHYDSNFGSKYPFWDQMFGSYLDESYLKDNFKFGVPNSDYNKCHPIIAFNFLPLIKIIKRVRSSNFVNNIS